MDWAALLEDLDRALEQLSGATGSDASTWDHGRRGGWTVGQHTAHVGICLARTAALFEEAVRALRSAALPPPPAKRDFLQSLWVRMVVRHGFMPRGGRTAPWAVPPERSSRAEGLEALRGGAARHRRLGDRLGASERERVWIVNPFMARWHYSLPEMVRVHAVHARHHAKQVVEIVARG